MTTGTLIALCVEQQSDTIMRHTPATVLMHDQIQLIKATCHAEALRLLRESSCDIVLYSVRDEAEKESTEFQEFVHQVSEVFEKPLIVFCPSENIADVSQKRVEVLIAESRGITRLNGPTGAADEGGLFQDMVGRCASIKKVFNLIERLAPYNATVLITGETGTGKEMVARAIHAMSPRRAMRFVTCNCAAFPEPLFESELFGHLKGAFTGAVQQREGLFRHAHGGTIFLDEIGEMPLSLQAKLLRVIENNEIRPVGSDAVVSIDARIVVATNKDLWQSVMNGTFRKDLFYRLNVAGISLPPLRERREDIPLLCNHFVDQIKQKNGLSLIGCSEEALKLLTNYEWPGNIRELKNTLESTALIANGEQMTIRDLPPFLQEFAIAHHEQILTSPSQLTPIDAREKSYIEEVLARFNGNKAQAAEALGLSRRSLYRRLEKLGCHVEES
jgi:DNA-binding NtrC family response regulator